MPVASSSISVAFCADRRMEVPLHVAMASLLRHLRPGLAVDFYLILNGWSGKMLHCLQQTLDTTGRTYRLHRLMPNSLDLFRRFPTLHGSLATYHRLLLPELVGEPRLLYLDADILVTVDIAPLFELDMQDYATGFVFDGTVACMIDRDFQIARGRSPQAASFNAGVFLMNLPAWHRQHCSDTVFAFAEQYGSQLVNRDQTLLNALFADHSFAMDRRFNITVRAIDDPATLPAAAIIHYYGAPKPWDLAARALHRSAPAWHAELARTALPWVARQAALQKASWQRLPHILHGYKAPLRARFFSSSPTA